MLAHAPKFDKQIRPKWQTFSWKRAAKFITFTTFRNVKKLENLNLRPEIDVMRQMNII